MSAEVQIHLFGSFELNVNGQNIHLPTRKMETLLAYLVLHRTVQTRERLASLLWGDSPEELAPPFVEDRTLCIAQGVGG
jgi:DNA-binding SARP family transcriptional activator